MHCTSRAGGVRSGISLAALCLPDARQPLDGSANRRQSSHSWSLADPPQLNPHTYSGGCGSGFPLARTATAAPPYRGWRPGTASTAGRGWRRRASPRTRSWSELTELVAAGQGDVSLRSRVAGGYRGGGGLLYVLLRRPLQRRLQRRIDLALHNLRHWLEYFEDDRLPGQQRDDRLERRAARLKALHLVDHHGHVIHAVGQPILDPRGYLSQEFAVVGARLCKVYQWARHEKGERRGGREEEEVNRNMIKIQDATPRNVKLQKRHSKSPTAGLTLTIQGKLKLKQITWKNENVMKKLLTKK